MSAPFLHRRLTALTIDDEAPLKRLPIYAQLKQRLIDDKYTFRVLASRPDGNCATLLNLAYWAPRSADILAAPRIFADVVAHVAWHHLATHALGKKATSADGLLFAESIASAFDLYLVGYLLRTAPRAQFLATQVPLLADVAQAAGLTARKFSALLQSIADDPAAAFGQLQQLLFTVSTRLARAKTAEAAARAIEQMQSHRFFVLLHHYNVANWILFGRAYAAPIAPRVDATIAKLATQLARAENGCDWLIDNWVVSGNNRP